MNKSITYLTGFLVVLGCLGYLYVVGWACVKSWPLHAENYELPSFLTNLATSIGALMATNLGAVLGIRVTDPHSKFSQAKTWTLTAVKLDPSPAVFQTFACYVYVLSLLAATIVWGHREFITDAGQIVPIIPEFTKTFAGVIVGALAISLNRNA